MKIFRDKEGKNLSVKEFMSRWVDGMERVTPLQQTRIMLFGYALIMLGIITGVIFAFIGSYYWLVAVLVGSLIINFFGFIQMLQKVRLFKHQEEFMRRAKETMEEEVKYIG